MILKLGITLLIIGLILFFSKITIQKLNRNYPKKYRQKNHNFCILIPARNESKVIEDLLKSIQKQTVKIPMKDVYVIVEDENDPTIKITKKHKSSVIVRKKLDLKRKGYALMEAINEILKNGKDYSAYFIFDADNILDKNYIKEMTKTYDAGYDIGIGYRNSKNGNENAVAASSSLIFTIINTVGNQNKTENNINSTISGTGFYIRGNWIKKWKTYPFHTLTEDYELSLYAMANNLTTYYNTDAIYYDEQPTSYKEYKTQRTRWIKGYFEARNKYRKKLIKHLKLNNPNYGSIYSGLIGVWDIILILIGIILILIYEFIKIFTGINIISLIIRILCILIGLYIILILFTVWLLYKEEEKFNLTWNIKIKTIFLHPFLLLAYIPCAITAIFTKDLKWKPITHGEHYDKKI